MFGLLVVPAALRGEEFGGGGTVEQGIRAQSAVVLANWRLTGRRELLLTSAASADEQSLWNTTGAKPNEEAALSPARQPLVRVLSAALLLLATFCAWTAARLRRLGAGKHAVEQENRGLSHDLQVSRQEASAFRSVVETIVDGVIIGTPEGIITAANPGLLSILGKDLDAVVGKHVSELFSSEVLRKTPLRVDLFPSGELIVNEREIRRPDGTRVQIEMRSRRMPDGNCHSLIRDITERKRTEEELNLKTAELEDFFSSALDLLCIADMHGQFVRVSREWERVLGYSVTELDHHSFLDFVHPDDLPATQAAVARLARQEEIPSFINRYRCRDGSYRHIEWRAVPRGERVHAAARDVTDRLRTEDALRRTQFAMDRATDAIFWVNPEARVSYANDAACASLGYSREELLRMRVSDFDPNVDETSRIGNLGTLREGERGTFESLHIAKDGRTFPVEISRNFVEFDGQWFSCSFVRDISERKRVEEALERTQFTVDHASDSVFWVDADGRILYVNDAACASLGYTREEMLGMRIPDLDVDFDEEAMARHAVELRQAGSVVFESRQRTKSGTIIPVEVCSNYVELDRQWFACAFVRDISERKEAEITLRRTQFAVDHASDSVFWVNADGQIMYVNDAACASLGYSREELLRMSVAEVDVDFDQKALADHKGRLRELESLVLESRHRTKDGCVVPVEVCVSYVDFGGEAFSCAFVRDISQRKQAERTLRRTQFALDRAHDGVFWLDTEGRFIYANDSACESLGYSREELLGMRGREVEPSITESMATEFWGMLREHGSALYETCLIAKDGGETPVEVSAYQIEFGDEGFACCFVRDITERKQAEEALRQSEETFRNIIEASPMGVHLYELQEDGRLLFAGANPAADRLLGVSHDQFVGRTIEDAFPALRETDIAEHYRRVAASGEPWKTQQTDYDEGGISGAFEVHAFQMSPGKTAVLFLDIAERLRNAAQQQVLQERLHQAQKLESVGRLAGGVAHEFNNMLQTILGYTEMALEQTVAESLLHDDIKEIQRVAERSADLTRQLLAFARRQTVVPKVIDLNTTVAETLGMLRRLIGEEIRLVWTPDSRLWPVKIDADQIGMVLANLCVNSRDAISGTGCVTIESHNAAIDDGYCALHADASVGDYVMLSVSDDGCGMSQEVLARIFDPFFTTKDVDKGTGLGLSTVHGIALQNGGFVTASSDLGEGTTVRMYLPRHQQDAPPPPSQQETREVVGGTETVLVVEDEPALLGMCGEALERMGYRVLRADHPKEALALVEERGEGIDLLVTDVIMPDMNGNELASRLASLNPGLRCLYMSGYPESAISDQGILKEGLEFIPKPFSRRALACKVREILDSREDTGRQRVAGDLDHRTGVQ